MQLLKKSEVQAAKNLDRKREIDEGVKLAKRVDALRQAASTEEASLKHTRDAALAELHRDVAELVAQKTTLRGEIPVLQAQKAEALRPLDEEWHRLREFEASLAERDEETRAVEASNDTRAHILDLQDTNIALEKERTLNDRERSKKLLEEAFRDSERAKEIKAEAVASAKESDAQVRIREKALKIREGALLLRIIATDARGNSQDEREIEQNNRDRALNDKYETLLRTEARIKK